MLARACPAESPSKWPLSRHLADSFAGTALRPPLVLALESLVTEPAFDPTAE